MYTPKSFQVTDSAEIAAFVQHHAFATVVSIEQEKPIATHIPLHVHTDEEQLYFTGHVARANPQWRTFESGEVLAIFQGPHAYVSSSWYTIEQVPTWNYEAVHIYGTVEWLDEAATLQHMDELLKKYEEGRPNAVTLEGLTPALVNGMLKGLVAFRLNVTSIEATYKLSQNRSDIDYMRVVEGLRNEQKAEAAATANEMTRLRKK